MQNQALEGYRLSPQQRRLWYLQDGSSAFRSWCAIKIEGGIEDAALREAVESVIGRYDILRTRFHKRVGIKMPIQVVEPEIVARWVELDLRGMEESAQRAKLHEVYTLEGESSLEPDLRSNLRAALVRLGENERVLIINLPSLCADGWAVKRLAREITTACSRHMQPVEEAPNHFQYFDFAEWQNELLESVDEEARRAKAHWEKASLRNELLVLPREKRAENAALFAPLLVGGEMGATVVHRIREVASKFGVTELDVLATCWAALIRRLSGRDEVVIWAVLDGRKYEELKEAVGLYAKSVPVRVRIEEATIFAALLTKLSEAIRESYKLHEYYFDDESAANKQAPGEYPIAFEHWDGTWSHTQAGTTFTPLKQYSCIDRFKIKLSLFQSRESLSVDLQYDSNVYDRQTAEQMAGWLKRLIESAVSDPETAINKLDILDDIERHRLIVELNDTGRADVKEKCIHELFEDQAALTPEAVAAVFEDEFLTYRALNQRANQLAHYLRALGIAPDRLVALYLDRSLDLLVGIWGILKAGGAYVPIDPASPKKRLAMILEDTAAAVILTTRQLAMVFGEYDGKVVCFDADRDVISEQDDSNPQRSATPENLVYAIFTSGSTGRPKGVAVEHKQLHNYVCGVIERLSLPARASFATVSTFSADLGNTAIYPSLLSGGCLHIISLDRAIDPVALGDYFSRRHIDCLKIVPSHLAALLASANPEILMPRQRLVLGGEASRSIWVEELHRLAPACAISITMARLKQQ